MTETFAKIERQEQQLLCRSYSRYPIAIVKGSGCMLTDINGKEYIDLLSGIGVVALGHCNPEVCKALEEQAGKLWHVSNLFYQEPQLELARELLATAHFGKAFFCNSGAEANEACIKLARRYMRKIKKRNAYEIITLEGCFHGRTLATLAANARESLSDGFTPLPAGFKQVPSCNLEAMEKAITPATAAVLLECVQGEGGVIPLPADYLASVASLCKDKDILLICDEVQCGLCRTGKTWAFQHAGIEPDAISIAKALANGLPMGAMLATDELARGFEAGSHATTFGGGALTSATAAKVLEIMARDKIAEKVADTGNWFFEQLNNLWKKYPVRIREVRGIGLMVGIELISGAKEAWEALLEAGFICNLSHGVTLRLLPPLIIGKEELSAFINAFDRILSD